MDDYTSKKRIKGKTNFVRNYVKEYGNILFYNRIEPENEYYDGEKDQDRDGAEEKT